MSMSRLYLTDSGLVAIAATGLTPLLYYAPPSTADGNMTKVKVSVEVSGSTWTAVSNSNLFFTLNKVTGTKAGGAAVTPQILGPQTLAANIVASSGSTALTGLTQGAELWPQPIPYSIGSSAGDDDPNTGQEIYLAPSGQYAFYVNVPTGPGFGANAFARVMAWHSE